MASKRVFYSDYLPRQQKFGRKVQYLVDIEISESDFKKSVEKGFDKEMWERDNPHSKIIILKQ